MLRWIGATLWLIACAFIGQLLFTTWVANAMRKDLQKQD